MNYIIKSSVFLVIILLITNYTSAQTFEKDFNTTIKEVRNNSYYKGVVPFLSYCKSEPQNVLKLGESVLKDTLSAVRNFSYELIALCGLKNDDKKVKEQSVSLLVNGLSDKDQSIRKKNVGKLKQFSKEFYSKQSIKSIEKLFKTGIPYEESILLAGFLDLKSTDQFLKDIVADKKNKYETRWEASLALARMGDALNTDYCIETIKGKPINSNAVQFLYPDLVYMRQPKSISYLINQLYNDDLNCNAQNPDSNAKITCAYRIMELLAPIILDFPYKVGYDGQLRASNYEEALKKSREWFKNNINYQIVTDKY